VCSDTAGFRCVDGNYDGFVRVSKDQPLAFEHDSGRPYYPVGINLVAAWAPPERAIPPERNARAIDLLRKLGAAGANFARLRADSYYHPVEATPNRTSGFLGAGWYHQKACWELDRIYETAEQSGVHIMHCFYNANSIVGGHINRNKGKHAFSLTVNGGPCAEPDEFWTNKDMLELVRRKLRYSVARWGYSRNLMCWEFFNEVGGLDKPVRIAWHRDMSRHLRSIDPYAHPISTSSHYGKDNQDAFWAMPEMDFVQTHVYGRVNNVSYLSATTAEITGSSRKPVLYGEWGLHAANRTWNDADPEGIGVHNAIWSTALAGGMGVADWYVSYMEKSGLFRHYHTFTDWAEMVPWNSAEMRPLEVAEVVVTLPPGERRPRDILLVGESRDTFGKMPVERFPVSPETGEVENVEYLQPMLHGMESRKTRPTFVLDCTVSCRFLVYVSESNGDDRNKLHIYLDGSLVKTEPLPANEEEGTRRMRLADGKKWRVFYSPPREIAVDIPAGKHEVMIEAEAMDRFRADYRISNYVTGTPPVQALGRRTNNRAWLWLHNTASTAANCRAKIPTVDMAAAEATLRGLPDGDYQVTWYDCWLGTDVRVDNVSSKDARLTVTSPPFTRDVAAIVAPASHQ